MANNDGTISVNDEPDMVLRFNGEEVKIFGAVPHNLKMLKMVGRIPEGDRVWHRMEMELQDEHNVPEWLERFDYEGDFPIYDGDEFKTAPQTGGAG